MFGRPGWYVPTIGTLLLFILLGRGLNVYSLVFKLALWICCKTNTFLYSLATRNVHRSAAIRSNASDVEHILRSLGGLSVWYAVLVHPGVTGRMEQKLVFICWLYVLVSFYSSLVIYYLDIQVIRAFFMPVPRKRNRIMGLFDVRQKFHQFILEDTKNIEESKSSFSFLLHLFLFFSAMPVQCSNQLSYLANW